MGGGRRRKGVEASAAQGQAWLPATTQPQPQPQPQPRIPEARPGWLACTPRAPTFFMTRKSVAARLQAQAAITTTPNTCTPSCLALPP